MADQIGELLGQCKDAQECFASDESALRSMLLIDDGGIRVQFQRIAAAADHAATEGIPLEDGVYTEVILRVVGRLGSLVDGETKSLGDILRDPRAEEEYSVENSAARIARCAYACGQAGVGGCPVKAPKT